ncbi:MAG TPA: GNAT family N-acetyltransferase [Oligoflexus sp.]|uniref:GNAT family N-acetyltransferase n=1 Tax=Oligoflexus sp. TaxID=1971216 RepID=UPI002D67BEE0|nr:GNAT family N-acetyltransferase [Oligoflexus sp.]HYX35340.1 GNAT family N-acetyltransferase [Oligoflexus sp.]
MDIKVLLNGPVPYDQLSELYTLVGWNRDGSRTSTALQKMLEKTSHYVTAFDGTSLVGFGRVISDEIFLFQLSDVMVRPEYRKQGIGMQVLRTLLDALPANAGTIRMIDGFISASIWEKLGYHTVPAEKVMYALLEKDELKDKQKDKKSS